MEEEEYDSESTIVGDELLDANIPTLSSENTKRQSRWVEGVWNKWIESLRWTQKCSRNAWVYLQLVLEITKFKL